MEAFYLKIPRDITCAEDALKSLLELTQDDPARDWNAVCGLLSRCVEEYGPAANLDPAVVDQLADLHVYIELDDSGGSRSFRCRPTIQRLKQAAEVGRFKRLKVANVATLGRDLREVVATVHDLTSLGMMIVPMKSDAEPIGSELVGPLRQVLIWDRETDHERRSAAIKAGQTKVRRRGTRVGRPKRIFDREEVVRLRDEEGRSWSQIAEALGIGVGTARRAYTESAASRGPAKTIREVA
jgi:DNA invertase Pin-like site-specific DNA recombinase